MKRLALILAIVASMAAMSCGPRKNTAMSRSYQAFITRYNIYHNGDEHYRETLRTLETNYEDDYSRLLYLHPADARRDPTAPQPSGDFTRSIEKAQKAIQLRSIKVKPKHKPGRSNDPTRKEWLSRQEYNPFIHNSWLQMGRAQYLNGDFLGAASTFGYIVKHFPWLPEAVTEAKLRQAHAYLAMRWDFEAETILTRIVQTELTSTTLRQLYDNVYATMLLQSADPTRAIPFVSLAERSASGPQKSRLNFLLGQLYAQQGDRTAAYRAFGRASGAQVSPRARLNARIKQSEVFQGSDITPEVKALRRLSRLDRNKPYLDQIYYAIGNLYLSQGDTTTAIDSYRLAAEKSTRNAIDKAISQLRLGGIYFNRRRYDLAQPCYADAVPLLPKDYPGLDSITRRSDVLDKLALYAQNVALNDSLLRLAEMSEPEQRAVVDRIIADLKKKEAAEAEAQQREEAQARREQAQATREANINRGNAAAAPQTFAMSSGDDSWYFYNTATRNAGRTEFQKRWGSRKLEDNWRRRNKASFNLNDIETTADSNAESAQPDDADRQESITATTVAADSSATDPHSPDYYLRQIPSTDEEKLIAHNVIQEGLYNMGLILKDDLESVADAQAQWLDLLNRYPDNAYRIEVYHNMYLMYMRAGLRDLAEGYRQKMLSEFPDSKYALAMRDPDYLDKLRAMDSEQESLYGRAYAAYLDNRNAEVHEIYDSVSERYPLSKIMPKFMFIHALSYVTEGQPDKFRATLKEMLERYPEADAAGLASSWLRGLVGGKQLNQSTDNHRGMLWDLRLSADTTSTTTVLDSLAFDLNPDEPQLLVLLFPTDELSAHELLYEVARHNFSSFVVRDFDLEPMNFGRLGLLLIKGFANFEELSHYRRVMDESTRFKLPPQVTPVMISVRNFETLLRTGSSFDDYFRIINSQTPLPEPTLDTNRQ